MLDYPDVPFEEIIHYAEPINQLLKGEDNEADRAQVREYLRCYHFEIDAELIDTYFNDPDQLHQEDFAVIEGALHDDMSRFERAMADIPPIEPLPRIDSATTDAADKALRDPEQGLPDTGVTR